MEFISDPSQMELPSAMDFNIHPSLSSAISNTFSSSGFSLLLRWTSSYTFSSSGFSLLLRWTSSYTFSSSGFSLPSQISPLQLHRRSAMESISDPSQICDEVHLRSAMKSISDPSQMELHLRWRPSQMRDPSAMASPKLMNKRLNIKY
ncbi:hypothetical protein ACOSQ4_032341 [Xanthoceras sorbifolium]